MEKSAKVHRPDLTGVKCEIITLNASFTNPNDTVLLTRWVTKILGILEICMIDYPLFQTLKTFGAVPTHR